MGYVVVKYGILQSARTEVVWKKRYEENIDN
jgi:hypothetical protein